MDACVGPCGGITTRDAFVGAEGAEASNEGDHIKLVRVKPLREQKIKTKTKTCLIVIEARKD